MQKRKIDDSVIWETYKKIIAGESLTSVAKSVELDRGTLRKYIESVVEPNLNEDEKLKFHKVINKNFRGNSTKNKSKNKYNVKKRAAEEIEKSEAIKELANYGVTPGQIEDLYKRLKGDERTAFAKDTYIYKYLEHLYVLSELGFTAQEVFDIFMRRPKLFSGSANKMKEIYDMHVRNYGSEEYAKQKMIDDPWADLRKKEEKVDKNEEVSDCGGGR